MQKKVSLAPFKSESLNPYPLRGFFLHLVVFMILSLHRYLRVHSASKTTLFLLAVDTVSTLLVAACDPLFMRTGFPRPCI